MVTWPFALIHLNKARMPSRVLSRSGACISVLTQSACRTPACSSILQRPWIVSSHAIHTTTQDIDNSNDNVSTHTIAPQGNNKSDRRSPFPVVLPAHRPAFSKPAHSPQYDPSRAPSLPSSTGTLERPQLSEHLREALPTFAAQTPHYATIHIHGKPYLVTVGDTIRLPFLMHGVAPGDILRLNRATILGSREWTLQGGTIAGTPTPGFLKTHDTKDATPEHSRLVAPAEENADATESTSVTQGVLDSSPGTGATGAVRRKGPSAYVDERLYTIRAVVMGTESEPLRIKEKKKQRTRRTKTVKSKHRFTILRIKELEVKSGYDVGFETV